MEPCRGLFLRTSLASCTTMDERVLWMVDVPFVSSGKMITYPNIFFHALYVRKCVRNAHILCKFTGRKNKRKGKKPKREARKENKRANQEIKTTALTRNQKVGYPTGNERTSKFLSQKKEHTQKILSEARSTTTKQNKWRGQKYLLRSSFRIGCWCFPVTVTTLFQDEV